MSSYTCPLHGEYPDTVGGHGFEVQNQCPECSRLAQQAEKEYRAQCSAYDWWCRHSGIPARYRNRTLANWKPQNGNQQAAAKLVRDWIGKMPERIDAGQGLTLLGPPGLGKTHLLTAVVSEACRLRVRARYWSWPDLIGQARDAFNSPPDDPRRQVLEKAATCQLLALDEIGHGSGTDWERLQLFELIDHRYREGLPTLAASNQTARTLPDVIGERLSDRLSELNATILLSGESQRGNVQVDGGPAIDEPLAAIRVQVCFQNEIREREITNPFIERSAP